MTPHRIEIQVRFADTDAVGHTSFTLGQVVSANGAVAAEVKSVIVSFDYQAQRSVPIPPTFRQWLESRM